MNTTSPRIAALVAAILCLTACNGNTARISGRFAGTADAAVVLNLIDAAGIAAVDSTTTDRNGSFHMKVALPSYGTALYTLRVADASIPLLVSPGEKISLSSPYGQPRDYTVEGSEESALLKEIDALMNGGTRKLDSLAVRMTMAQADSDRKSAYIKEYIEEYARIKREQIRFIIANSSSLAAVYALYQRLPNDNTLFNGPSDIVYYRLVADSAALRYPSSPYVAALRRQVESEESGERIARMLNESLAHPVSYPDIVLPDIHGKTHRLSDLDGCIILVEFWDNRLEAAPMRNAELRGIYERFAGNGLEIYQVDLSGSARKWVEAVQAQQLPWICVADPEGLDGTTAKMYNIASLPANFVIAPDGEIIARDTAPEDLAPLLESLASTRH